MSARREERVARRAAVYRRCANHIPRVSSDRINNKDVWDGGVAVKARPIYWVRTVFHCYMHGHGLGVERASRRVAPRRGAARQNRSAARDASSFERAEGRQAGKRQARA